MGDDSVLGFHQSVDEIGPRAECIPSVTALRHWRVVRRRLEGEDCPGASRIKAAADNPESIDHERQMDGRSRGRRWDSIIG